jgi:chorismate dehydratase
MPKIGCVPYINALPLTYFLDRSQFEIITRPPAQLLDLLQKGEVEAALLPIVNYLEDSNLRLISNLAIAARGPVKSVKLFFKDSSHSIENLKHVLLDSESRTSNLLLKTLLKHRYGRNLSEVEFLSSDPSSKAEARLLIGDKALDHLHPHEKASDLAELWWEWTHKPFVFAAWMTRQTEASSLVSPLSEAREKGLAQIETIIRGLPQYPPDFLKEYFTTAVQYYMGPPELEGIRAFFEFLKPIQGYRHELDFRFVS